MEGTGSHHGRLAAREIGRLRGSPYRRERRPEHQGQSPKRLKAQRARPSDSSVLFLLVFAPSPTCAAKGGGRPGSQTGLTCCSEEGSVACESANIP